MQHSRTVLFGLLCASVIWLVIPQEIFVRLGVEQFDTFMSPAMAIIFVLSAGFSIVVQIKSIVSPLVDFLNYVFNWLKVAFLNRDSKAILLSLLKVNFHRGRFFGLNNHRGFDGLLDSGMCYVHNSGDEWVELYYEPSFLKFLRSNAIKIKRFLEGDGRNDGGDDLLRVAEAHAKKLVSPRSGRTWRPSA